MTPYARILMGDDKPVLRMIHEVRTHPGRHPLQVTNEIELTSANLFLLMKDGMSALIQLAQAGELPGFIAEDPPK